MLTSRRNSISIEKISPKLVPIKLTLYSPSKSIERSKGRGLSLTLSSSSSFHKLKNHQISKQYQQNQQNTPSKEQNQFKINKRQIKSGHFDFQNKIKFEFRVQKQKQKQIKKQKVTQLKSIALRCKGKEHSEFNQNNLDFKTTHSKRYKSYLIKPHEQNIKQKINSSHSQAFYPVIDVTIKKQNMKTQSLSPFYSLKQGFQYQSDKKLLNLNMNMNKIQSLSPFFQYSQSKSYSPQNQLLVHQQQSIKIMKKLESSPISPIKDNISSKKEYIHTHTPMLKNIKNRILKLEDIPTVYSKYGDSAQKKSKQNLDNSWSPILDKKQYENNNQDENDKKTIFQQNNKILERTNKSQHLEGIISEVGTIQEIVFKNTQKIENESHSHSCNHSQNDSLTKIIQQIDDSFFDKYELQEQSGNSSPEIAFIKPIKRKLSLQTDKKHKQQCQKLQYKHQQVQPQKQLQQINDSFFVQQILSSLEKNHHTVKQKCINFQLIKNCSKRLSLIKQKSSQYLFGCVEIDSQKQNLIQFKNAKCLSVYFRTPNFCIIQPFQYSLDELYFLKLLPTAQLLNISKTLKQLTIELHQIDFQLQFDLQNINQKIVYLHGVFKFIPLVIRRKSK